MKAKRIVFKLMLKKNITEQDLLEILDALSDEQRLTIINRYCKYCGSKDTKCQCWNDD